MALVKVYNSHRPIPPGGGSSVLRLKAHPKPGYAFEMFRQNFGFVARGRLVSAATGLTNYIVRIAAHEVGAPEGLEATILTVSSTSVTAATSYPLPIIDILQTGTTSDPSTMSLVLGFGFPLKALEVISARSGQYWKVGDDLLDPRHSDCVLAR